MSNPFDWNRHIIETSLKYDDHNPKQRKELENYLVQPEQLLKKSTVKKTKPKQLTKKDNEVKKVVISPKEPLLEVEDNVKKVEIKKEDNAIQIGETEEVSVEEPSGDSTKVGEPVQ